MTIQEIHLVYFSATFTTRTVVRKLADSWGVPVVEHDITSAQSSGNIYIDKEGTLLIIGMPVYAGRIPALAAETLRQIKGNGTPAIAVCVYGNRDYDDALLELKDLIEAQGFVTIAAAAFVAQHSIFPAVGAGRPDEADLLKIAQFGEECKAKLEASEQPVPLPATAIKGNRPYKVPSTVMLHPAGKPDLCNRCGTCVEQCPTAAIPADDPCRTDDRKCISCGRCIAICPRQSRGYTGAIYEGASAKFTQAFSARKEPECFL